MPSSRVMVVVVVVVVAVQAMGCHLVFPYGVTAPDPDRGPGQEASTSDAAVVDALTPDGPGLDQAVTDAAPDKAVPDAVALDLPAPDGPAVVDLKPSPDQGLLLGAACTDPKQCQSGHCADGVCCDKACPGACQTCNKTGALGSCVNEPVTTICGKTCSGIMLTTTFCDGKGACLLGLPSSCGFTLCDPKTLSCPSGCQDNTGCFKGLLSSGVCDRTSAHLTGWGTCVDPKQVAEAGTATYGTLASAVSAVLASYSLTHVLLKAGTHKLSEIKVAGTGLKLVIVGEGAPTIEATNSQAAALVKGGGSLTLQGVQLTHTLGNNGDGAACVGAELIIVESEIVGNLGAGVFGAGDCNLTLRRSRVELNKLGGLDLSGGSGGNSTVVNNVIVNNGSPTSTVGGVGLFWSSSPMPTFYNNTIADNTAINSGSAGITCTAPLSGDAFDLRNTIVWGNTPKGASTDCKFTTSDIGGATMLTSGNISTNPLFTTPAYTLQASSPCLHNGSAVPASVTVIDHASGDRLKGKQTDMGAYEQ